MTKWFLTAELRGVLAEAKQRGDSEGELLFFFSAETLRLTLRNSAVKALLQLRYFKLTFRPIRFFG